MSELKSYQMYINGEWVDAKDGKTFESVNPSTGNSWAIIPEAGETDVDVAVQSAPVSYTHLTLPTILLV